MSYKEKLVDQIITILQQENSNLTQDNLNRIKQIALNNYDDLYRITGTMPNMDILLTNVKQNDYVTILFPYKCKLIPFIEENYDRHIQKNDGNCLFYSLGHALLRSHDTVRREICQYMITHPDFFDLDQIKMSLDEGPIAYITKMSQDKSWGGYIELCAAALLYKRHIIIHNMDNTTNDIGDNLLPRFEIVSGAPIHLYYCNTSGVGSGVHYELLTPKLSPFSQAHQRLLFPLEDEDEYEQPRPSSSSTFSEDHRRWLSALKEDQSRPSLSLGEQIRPSLSLGEQNRPYLYSGEQTIPLFTERIIPTKQTRPSFAEQTRPYFLNNENTNKFSDLDIKRREKERWLEGLTKKMSHDEGRDRIRSTQTSQNRDNTQNLRNIRQQEQDDIDLGTALSLSDTPEDMLSQERKSRFEQLQSQRKNKEDIYSEDDEVAERLRKIQVLKERILERKNQKASNTDPVMSQDVFRNISEQQWIEELQRNQNDDTRQVEESQPRREQRRKLRERLLERQLQKEQSRDEESFPQEESQPRRELRRSNDDEQLQKRRVLRERLLERQQQREQSSQESESSNKSITSLIKILKDRLEVCVDEIAHLEKEKRDILIASKTMDPRKKEKIINMQIPEIDRMRDQYNEERIKILEEIKQLSSKRKYLKYKTKYLNLLNQNNQ